MNASSALVLASAMLCAFASATEALEGRQLHVGNKGESRSNYYTKEFPEGAAYHGEVPTFEGNAQLGLILGFITTGFFMIFGVVVLIQDECKRHESFKKIVSDDIVKLKTTYNVTDAEIQQYENEFLERESMRGKAVDVEKERLAIAEIN